MTPFEVSSLAISALQLTLAVGGFWIVYRTLRILINQTELLRHSVDVTSSASVGARQLEVDEIFLDRPPLRKYFFDGVSVERGHPDYEAAVAAAQLLANYFDTYFLQRGKYGQLYADEAWCNYIGAHIQGSPILRWYILQFKGWYTTHLVELAQSHDKTSLERV